MNRLLEGFDKYITVSQMYIEQWTTGDFQDWSFVTPGRFGGQAVRLGAWNRNFGVTLDNQDTWIAGTAFKFDVNPNATIHLIAFYDGANDQSSLYITNTHKLAVGRAGSGVIHATGSTTLMPNVWYYLELKATIHNTTGSIEARINGVSEVSATNVNTRTSGNNYANRIIFGGQAGIGGLNYWDDLYIHDGTGTKNNNFSGNCMVYPSIQEEAGFYNQWNGTPGPNVDNIRDLSGSDGDLTYNYSDTVNQIDTFKMTNAPISAGNVLAVQHRITARTDGAGARTIALVERVNGTDYVATAKSVPGSYGPLRYNVDVNPDTGDYYTAAEYAAAEQGYKLIS